MNPPTMPPLVTRIARDQQRPGNLLRTAITRTTRLAVGSTQDQLLYQSASVVLFDSLTNRGEEKGCAGGRGWSMKGKSKIAQPKKGHDGDSIGSAQSPCTGPRRACYGTFCDLQSDTYVRACASWLAACVKSKSRAGRSGSYAYGTSYKVQDFHAVRYTKYT